MELGSIGAVEPLKATHQSEQDLTVYCSSWIWRAVECLVKAPDFNASPKWIAERLNVSVEKAVDALDGLERIQAIKRSANGFEATTDMNIVNDVQLQKSDLLSIQSKLAPQFISKLTDQDIFTTQVFLGDLALVRRFTKRLSEVLDEMSQEGLKSGSKDVMALELSFVTLSTTVSEGRIS